MGIEIERKFLVKSEDWRGLGQPVHYAQGYLIADGERTVRVRIAGDNGYITVKGRSEGMSRREFEYPVPIGDAIGMLELSITPVIEKYRTRISCDGKVWEVDEFEGENKGLIMAEIELSSEDEDFSLPRWIGEEVTGDLRFYNSHLAVYPYSQWK